MKTEACKDVVCGHLERLARAEEMLRVWFYEMDEAAKDGEYDCTCEYMDECPYHRVADFLGFKPHEILARVEAGS